ncbi:C-C motif chemokine 5-like [Xenopus laevis]|uniref:C-C motif chemokine 5-like n=1 Tax=Xenopus laevis TaxID=8355 RepID=A0A8J1MGL4_XENLA|nr:C-C motif chemokine 5-like [Xenopus laevis]
MGRGRCQGLRGKDFGGKRYFQVLLCVVTLLLLAVCYSQVNCGSDKCNYVGTYSTPCCFKFAPLSFGRIQSYYTTSSLCSNPAIIFITKNGKVCTNPNDSWVIDYKNHLDRQSG